jgi:hypothetical protein
MENLQRTRPRTQKTKANVNNKEIEKFIRNRTNKEQQQEQQFAEQQQATVEKQKKYIVLPYSNNK